MWRPELLGSLQRGPNLLWGGKGKAGSEARADAVDTLSRGDDRGNVSRGEGTVPRAGSWLGALGDGDTWVDASEGWGSPHS